MLIDIKSDYIKEKNTVEILPKGFIYLNQICPSIKQDIKYATIDNFTGTIIRGYNANLAILSTQASNALMRVQEELKLKNQTLLIWDAYRPTQAVDYFLEWEHEPDNAEIKEKYYPHLNKKELFETGFIAPGHSTHSRGSTVDLTIFDNNSNQPLNMGTDFDFFGEESHTENKNISIEAQKNRKYFIELMSKHGFENYPKEWWHFTLKNEPFPEEYFNFPVE